MATVRLHAHRILDAAAELAVGFVVFMATSLLLPTWLAAVLGVVAIAAESKRHDRERAAGSQRLLRPEVALIAALVVGAIAIALALAPVSSVERLP